MRRQCPYCRYEMRETAEVALFERHVERCAAHQEKKRIARNERAKKKRAKLKLEREMK